MQSKVKLDYKPQPKQKQLHASKANEILFGGSAGPGKALDIDTPIATPLGWVRMGDIEPGDFVFDSSGQPTRVKWCSDRKWSEDCWRILFDNKSSIIADGDHEWRTFSEAERAAIPRRTPEFRARRRATRKLRGTGKKPWLSLRNKLNPPPTLSPPMGTTRTTKEILQTLKSKDGKRTSHSIECAGSLSGKTQHFDIQPYLLGAWLGDGNSDSGIITNIDLEVIEQITFDGDECYKMRSGKYRWRITGLTHQLKKALLFKNKHIPMSYLRASYNQRVDLVRGLMDTDGSVDKDGCCEFTSIKKTLAMDCDELLCSLGIKTRMKKDVARLNGRIIGPNYRVRFTTSLRVFNIKRKYIRQHSAIRSTQKQHYIVNIIRAFPCFVCCIAVESSDHCFLAGKKMIPTHNSHALRMEGFIWCCRIPNLQVFLFRRTLPELDASHIRRGMQEFPGPPFCTWKEQKKRWQFHNGATLQLGYAMYERDIFRYQSAEINLLLIDELTTFTKFQYEYLLGRVRCTLDIPQKFKCRIPGVVAASNPGGIGHQFVKTHWIEFAKPYEMKKAPINEGGMTRQYIPGLLADNPILTKSDPGYIHRLEALPEPYRTAYLEGDWDIFMGQAFAFNTKDHVIKPLPVPDQAPLYFTFDWGFGKPYSAQWWWVDADGRIYLFAEEYGMMPENPNVGIRQADDDIADRIVAREKELGIWEKPITRLCDPTCFNKVPDRRGGGQGPSTAEEFAKKGIILHPGDPSRILKIRQFHMRLRVKRDKEGKATEAPMLQVYDTCKDFIRTIPTLQADQHNAEDINTDSEDHEFDAACHVCMARPMSSGRPYRTGSLTSRMGV